MTITFQRVGDAMLSSMMVTDIAIDDEVMKDSQNLVTSSAVFDAMNALSTAMLSVEPLP